MVFDTGSDADTHALERLQSDMIAWMTTITPEGQPQTFPIWFLWEGDGTVLLYSDYRAKRLVNIAANPRVSLHLNDNGQGGDIVVIEGTGAVDDATPKLADHAAYLAKYGAWIDQFLGSIGQMAEVYNVPVRITPVRGRAYGA
jgi:PPOX class probable F420-dependent enzyme